uniref:Putative bromodomain-containing protein n=1 Tax=Helianthus annuus TaxID=4232 RepID=A0A251UMW8_HELAN
MLKDTHVVFSEPVDPNELLDYHDIIKHPMDFGTVRSKLVGGLYSNLEELELICSNAIQDNSPDTVYFQQVELAICTKR